MGPQGPQGPPGPAGNGAPPPPPPQPYAGTFYFRVDGFPPIVVNSFAGCFEKVLGVEYEDCYFTTPRLPASLLAWLQDSIQGNSATHRNVTIYQVNVQTFDIIAEMRIADAFVREFSFAALNASSNDQLLMSFVIVPSQIELLKGGGNAPSPQNVTPMNESAFQFSMTGVEGNRVAAVSSLRLTWPKVEVQLQHEVDTRKQFMPGQSATADNIEVLFTQSATNTITNMNAWLQDVARGIVVPRNGTIELLSANFATVLREIQLTGVVPVFFPPFPTGGTSSVGLRSIVFSMQPFYVQ